MIVHADPEIIKQIAEDIKGPRRPRGAGHERAEQAELGGPGGAEMQIGNKQYGHGFRAAPRTSAGPRQCRKRRSLAERRPFREREHPARPLSRALLPDCRSLYDPGRAMVRLFALIVKEIHHPC